MPVNEKLWSLIEYEPHEKQFEFHASEARFKVAVAGRRFGKSRMAAAEVEPKIMERGTRGWIVGPQYKVGEKEFRYLWEDLVVKMRLGPDMKQKAYNVRTGEMYMLMPWGSRVDVMSADHPDSLVGEGLDWVIVSEAAKQHADVWEKYLRPALADKHGTAIFPSTPEGFNWFHGLYQLGQSTDPDWESWRYPAWENPYVYPGGFEDAEVQKQMRTPDDPWFWQEIGADFRSVVGLIYPEFDERKHVRRHTYRADWENQLWFDFGFTNPFVALDVQIAPDDTVYIWREYHERQRTASQHALELKARGNPTGYRIDMGYGDSADPQSVEEIGRHLCPIIAMSEAKDWALGVSNVKDFLAADKLFVDPSCVNTIAEFQAYKTSEPRTRDPRANVKEEPAKRMDHCMDAIRYGIMHKFIVGGDMHVTPDFLAPVAVNVEGGGLVEGADGIFTRDLVL